MKNKIVPVLLSSVLAVSSVSFCNTVVYADFGEFSGAVDYAVGVTGSELYSGITTGATGFSWVIAALVGIQAYNDVVTGAVDQGFTAGDLNTIVFCGYYNEDGDFRKLTSCGVSGLKNLTFIYADDFNIASMTDNSNGVTYTAGYTLAYPNYVYASDDYFVETENQFAQFSGMARYTFSSGSSAPYPTILSSDAVRQYFTGQYGSPSPIAKRIQDVTLPEPLSMTNGNYGDAYIRNVLKPYVEENYPDMMYIFAPSYIPEYPTDFVTGIPKEWTIENPQLPDIGKKHLVIPEFSWDSLDLSGLQEVSNGVGFWWALLGKAFQDFHLLPIALLVVALSVVGFVLWKLGG